MPRMWNWKETAIVGLESSSAPSIGRSAAKQRMDRSSEKYSKREEYKEKCKEDI